jgi:hypothetical protein
MLRLTAPMWPIVIILRQLLVCSCVAPSLKRGPVYSLHLHICFWASPAQPFFSGQVPVGLVICYCPKFETPPIWKARFPYLFPPRNGVAQLYPKAVGFRDLQSKPKLLPLRFSVEVKVILQPTASRAVCLGARRPSGTLDQIFSSFLWLLFSSYGLVDVEHPLWREVGSVVSSYCWESPRES